MDGIARLPKRGPVAGPLLGGSPLVSTTGYPWVDGDILYADDLNAAFLPITGGTITYVNNVPAGTPSQVISPLGINVTVPATVPLDIYTWGLNVLLKDHATGLGHNQDVAIAGSVEKYSSAATWQYFGQTTDHTGLAYPDTVGTNVIAEYNLRANGPENAITSFNPIFGNRCGLNLVIQQAYQPPAWQALHGYMAGDAIQPTPTNGFTYVCSVAGTSGSTQPTWPTAAGTVTDGTVTWRYGTTVNFQISRLIGISVDSTAQVGAGLFVSSGAFYDAILEFSGATLVDGGVKDAAIRLAANMPIDFSGNMTDAGQNVRTLRYNSAGQRLIYNATGVERFSVSDLGTVSIGAPPDFGFQLEVQGTNTVGIYTGAGTFSSAAIRLGTGQRLSFTDTSSDLLYFSTGQGLTYRNGSTDVAWFTPTGVVHALNYVFSTLPTNAINDAAAASAGVPVGGMYRNASALMVRVA